jgi:ArsR family transcriptional regulator
MTERHSSGEAAGGTPRRSPTGDVSATASLAKAFAALGDPVRLRILALITEHGEMCVCDLVEPLGRTQPTVSHHLRLLFESGLVERERRGSWTWYRVVSERLHRLGAALSAPAAMVGVERESTPVR